MSTTPQQIPLLSEQRSPDSPETPLLMAVPDAARLLGIGTTLAWELVRAGDLPSIKLGRRVLVPRMALEHLARSPMSARAQELSTASETPHPQIPTSHRDTAAHQSSP